MKKKILLLIILCFTVLVGCESTEQIDTPPVDDIAPTLLPRPVINGGGDVILNYGATFNFLDGITASVGGIPIEVTYIGEVDVYTPGTYEVTFRATNADGESTIHVRKYTVLEAEPVLANGTYSLLNVDMQTKLLFLSKAEQYLLDYQIGGINLFNSVQVLAFSSRFTPHNSEYISIVGFDLEHSTMHSDDTNVMFLHDIVGFENEYTFRDTISNNLNLTYNQYLYDTTNQRVSIEKVFSGLYQIVTNDEHTGFSIIPDLASDLPKPLNPTVLQDGSIASNTWRIPLRDDLLWYFHPEVDSEFIGGEFDQYITSKDFIETFKLAVDNEWFRAVSGGGDFLSGKNEIAGMKEYVDGTISFDEVGMKSVTENGIDYIELTFVSELKEFDVLYSFSSEVLSPIQTDLYEFLTAKGLEYGEDYKNVGYHGPYYVHENIEGEYLQLKRNPNYHEVDAFFIDNYLYTVCDATQEFLYFVQGYLDITRVPSTTTEYSSLKVYTQPKGTTYRMNLNRLGTIEAQQEQFEGSTYIPEPILSYDDFVLAMFHAVNRNQLANDILHGTKSPNMYYFSDAYIINPDSGLAYRKTDLGQTVGGNLSNETEGYDPIKAKELFLNTITQMLEDGTVVAGTESNYTIIEIDLLIYQDSWTWTDTANYIKTEFEKLFVDETNFVKVVITISEAQYPDIYYNYMMTGDFDIAVGGISGNLLCPVCFLDTFCSDNRTEFTLNFGIDTSIPMIDILYTDSEGVERYETFSYDAIASMMTGEVELIEGREAPNE